MTKARAGIRAPHGKKMIGVEVRFWTNNLAAKGKIVPRSGRWAASSGYRATKCMELRPVGLGHSTHSWRSRPPIERVLIEHGVRLHPSRKIRKYIV